MFQNVNSVWNLSLNATEKKLLNEWARYSQGRMYVRERTMTTTWKRTEIVRKISARNLEIFWNLFTPNAYIL